MRKILMATSALALFGASAALAQDYGTGVVGGQGLDTGVTTGSTTDAQPFWLPRQEFQAANSVKPSDQNDAPEPDFDVFDPGTLVGSTVIATPGDPAFGTAADNVDRTAVTSGIPRRTYDGYNAADGFDASY